MKLTVFAWLACIGLSFQAFGESKLDERFEAGKYVSTVQGAIGYSSFTGTLFAVSVNTQKFVQNRLGLGAIVSYSNVGIFEYYGVGPTASYYFWNNEAWRSFFGQGFEFLKYTGYSRGDETMANDETDVLGRTYVGIGWSFLDFVVGYNYVLDHAVSRRDGLSAGFQLSFFF